MKKILLMFAFVASAFSAFAQDETGVTATATKNADNTQAEVVVSLTSGKSYVAYQMDLVFSTDGWNGTAATAAAEALKDLSCSGIVGNAGATSVDMTVACNWINANTLRVVAYNLGNAIIDAEDGTEILKVVANTTNTAAWTVTIENVLFVTASALEEIKAKINGEAGYATVVTPTEEVAGLLGDVNLDGYVDTRDINALITVILAADKEGLCTENHWSITNANTDGITGIDSRDLAALIVLILA